MKRAFIGAAALCIACGGKLGLVPPPPPPPPEDAGADVASEADAYAVQIDASQVPGACVPGDDFDEPNAPHPEWTVSGTNLEIVDATFTSAPHSLLAGAASYLSTACSNVAYGMKLTAQFRVDADGDEGTPPALASMITTQGQIVELAAIPGTTNARCTMSGCGGPPVVHDFPLARGAWHHLGLKISFNDDGTNNLICEVDETDHGFLAPASQMLGTTTVRIGAQSTTKGAIAVYFDDVVVLGS